MTRNIALAGVGGQGSIFVAKILSAGLLGLGYDVKVSEVHGMARRGGSVVTHLRYGTKVFSPVITRGEADVLVAFEMMEAVRALHLLKINGDMIISRTRIPPVSAVSGAEGYPSGIEENLRQIVEDIVFVDAETIAQRLGCPKVQNVVVLGALVALLDLKQVDWAAIVKGFVPPGLYESNVQALDEGMSILPFGVRAASAVQG